MHAPHPTSTTGHPARTPLTRLFGRLIFIAHRLRSIARQRARLCDLDDRMLRDIGLTREEAQAEASRPLWDAPPHWRR